MLQKEKFVENNANAMAAGRVAGVDPIEEITKRCIRIVNTQIDEMGGCALCRFVYISFQLELNKLQSFSLVYLVYP